MDLSVLGVMSWGLEELMALKEYMWNKADKGVYIWGTQSGNAGQPSRANQTFYTLLLNGTTCLLLISQAAQIGTDPC